MPWFFDEERVSAWERKEREHREYRERKLADGAESTWYLLVLMLVATAIAAGKALIEWIFS